MYKLQPEKKSYKISFTFALLLHILIVAFFFLKLTSHYQETTTAPAVDIINAKAISQNDINSMLAKLNAEKQQQELAVKQKQEEQQKLLEARQKQIEAQKQAVLQQQEQLKQKELIIQKEKEKQQQKAEALKLEAQNKLQQKLAQEKADKETNALIQQQIQKEQKNESKTIASKIAAQKQALSMQAAMNKQLSDESKQIASNAKQIATVKSAAKNTQQSTQQNQAEIDKYKTMIIKAISDEWIIPQNLAPNTVCKLLVTVAPDGVVLKIDIIQKSGNDLLDSSAKTAVLKASPLPVPKDPDLFDNFRTLRLTAKPEGIVNDE